MPITPDNKTISYQKLKNCQKIKKLKKIKKIGEKIRTL